MAGHRFNKNKRRTTPQRIPHRRKPYGRRGDSYDLVNDPHMVRVPPSWVADLPGARYEVRSYPVGNHADRLRYTIKCPKCGRWVIHLYTTQGYEVRGPFWCRRCWGLRYPSQYQGRRPEASPERIAALLASAARARSPAVRDRRELRAFQATWTRYEREMAYLRRFGASFSAWWSRLRPLPEMPDE